MTTYKQLSGKSNLRAVDYSRCSSDEQKKNGYTIADQVSLNHDFIQEQNLIHVGSYVDEGISATLEIKKRKDLAKLIEDAEAGQFDIVIFKCIDRFFRNVGEYYECQKRLTKAGVTWVSIEEPDLDPADPDAVFKINIYLTMAEYEAKKTSKRILFNNKMRIKNKQVVCPSRCFLFPWEVTGEPKNKHLIKCAEKEHILYDLLDHYETHQSKAVTLAYINRKYDMTMNITTLRNLLQDTLLYGEYKGVPGFVEPYITKERFDKLQDIQKRNARYSENANHIFLFTGIVKCPYCGRNLTGNYQKPREDRKELFMYRCNKHTIEKTCSYNRSTSETIIERQMIENLETYIYNHIYRIKKINDNIPKNPSINRSKKLKDEMDRLNNMYRKGRIEEQEYDKEYMKLDRELKELNLIDIPKERDLQPYYDFLESDWLGIYNNLDREHKKAFWRNLIKEFALSDDKKIIESSIVFF